jgi:hypothetical protein
MRQRVAVSWMCLVATMAAMTAWPGCKKSDSATGPAAGSSVVTVSGKALGLNLQPLQHFPVVIAGHPATVSDDSGSFTVAGVQTPYTVTVIDPASASALVYIGLTRSDPALIWLSKTPGVQCNGAMAGDISGGGFSPAQGANDETQIMYVTPGTWATSSLTGAVSGSFGMGATWFGPTTTTGDLFALQFTTDPSTGLPVAGGFKAFGTATGVSVTDGQTRNGQALALQALQPSQTGTFSATIDVPAGFNLTTKSLFLRPNANGLIPILKDATSVRTLSYFAPTLANTSLTVSVQASNGSGSDAVLIRGGLSAGAASQTIAVIAPPELSLPVPGASFVDTTTDFSWKPMEGSVHYVLFIPTVGGNPQFEVVTTGASCRLPNLKAYGLTLPKGAGYSWGIEAFSPVKSMDEAADRTLFRALRRPGEITATAAFGTTPLRPFTTTQ